MNFVQNKAQEIVRDRRYNAETKAQKVFDDLLSKKDYHDNYVEINKLVFDFATNRNKGLPTDRIEIQLEKLRTVQQEIISKYGYKKSDLAPQYYCKKCQDTGFDGIEQCQCVKNIIREILLKDSNINDPDCSFSNSINNQNKKLYDIAQEFCKKYPNTKFNNILIYGKVGCGKTYLCNCIANEMINKSIPTFFITAYNLNNLFLKQHLADIQDKLQFLQNLYDVDILIIDDLGSEQYYKNVTQEYLFALINERQQNKKTTIITTNLVINDILSKYEERIFSRLTNKRNTLVAEMQTETDMRHTKH